MGGGAGGSVSESAQKKKVSEAPQFQHHAGVNSSTRRSGTKQYLSVTLVCPCTRLSSCLSEVCSASLTYSPQLLTRLDSVNQRFNDSLIQYLQNRVFYTEQKLPSAFCFCFFLFENDSCLL